VVDLAPLLWTDHRESGLTSVAVPPAGTFAKSALFVSYHAPGGDKSFRSVVAWVPLAEDGTANHADLVEVLSVDQGNGAHSGNDIAFDPSGLLYYSIGEDMKADQAQDLSNLAGSIVRISPDDEGGYSIPENNPFVDTEEGRRS